MIAAGKGWHAGRGEWQGVTDGNAHLIGIEAENIGTSDKHGNPLEPWPAVQMDAHHRGCAAILKHIGAAPIMCAGHKEYALPKGRKDDPNFDMARFRADVAALMAGPAPVKPTPKPAAGV
jgi:N-acetyl-anhydromuramyl-L-alanine amidase AmpD